MNDDSSSFTAIHVGDGEGKSRVFWRYPHRLPSSPGHVEMDLLFFSMLFSYFFPAHLPLVFESAISSITLCMCCFHLFYVLSCPFILLEAGIDTA